MEEAEAKAKLRAQASDARQKSPDIKEKRRILSTEVLENHVFFKTTFLLHGLPSHLPPPSS